MLPLWCSLLVPSLPGLWFLMPEAEANRGRDLIEYYLAEPQDAPMLPEDEIAAIMDAVTDLLHLAVRVMPHDPSRDHGTGADYVARVALDHVAAEQSVIPLHAEENKSARDETKSQNFVKWAANRPQTGLPLSMGGPHAIDCDLDEDCTCA